MSEIVGNVIAEDRFGFEEVGRRRNYYDLPKEDALILTRYFDKEEPV